MCQIDAVVKGIMTALSSAQQSEVKAWEEEILACEHTLTLHQEPLINAGDRGCFPCCTHPDGVADVRSPHAMYRVRP
jgi:ubiquitin carboxyl-terminal hydrolase 5/13